MQRFGWVVMLLVVVAGLAGVFGSGPIASAQVGEKGSALHVEYERLLRRDAPGNLAVYIGEPGIGADSTIKLWLDRRWLAGMEVKSITPEPEKTETGADRIVYTFRIDPSSTPAHITYHLENHSLGRLGGRIGLVDGPAYTFSQFAYP